MARQLFMATVVPTVEYASNVWSHTCGLREVFWLDMVPRMGAQAITGMFRMVASVVAEADGQYSTSTRKASTSCRETVYRVRTLPKLIH